MLYRLSYIGITEQFNICSESHLERLSDNQRSKSSLDPALRERLLKESQTPWRGLRRLALVRSLCLRWAWSVHHGLPCFRRRQCRSWLTFGIQGGALLLFSGLLWFDRDRSGQQWRRLIRRRQAGLGWRLQQLSTSASTASSDIVIFRTVDIHRFQRFGARPHQSLQLFSTSSSWLNCQQIPQTSSRCCLVLSCSSGSSFSAPSSVSGSAGAASDGCRRESRCLVDRFHVFHDASTSMPPQRRPDHVSLASVSTESSDESPSA